MVGVYLLDKEDGKLPLHLAVIPDLRVTTMTDIKLDLG